MNRVTHLVRARCHLLTGALVVPLLLMLAGCGGDDTTEAQHLAAAQTAFDAKEWKTAKIELQNAIRKNIHNGESRYLLGQVHLRLHDPRAAVKELTRALELDYSPQAVAVPLGRAFLLRNPQTAIKDLEILDTNEASFPAPVRAELGVIRGLALLRTGKLDIAKEEFNDAFGLAPQTPGALFSRALIAFHDEQDYEGAKKWIEQTLAADPTRAEAEALRGDVLLNESRLDDAVSAYRKAIELEPFNLVYRMALSELLIRNDAWDDAIAELDRILKVAPELGMVNYLRARAALRKRDFVGARDFAGVALKSIPEHVQTRYVAGTAEYFQGNYELAFEHLNRIQDAYARNRSYVKLMTATRVKLGLVDEALAGAEAVMNDPTIADAAFLGQVSAVAAGAGHLQAAERLISAAESVAEDDSEQLFSLGVTKLRIGDIEGSIDAIEKAAKLDPSLVGAEAILIVDKLRSKSFDEASRRAEALIAAHPKSPLGHNLIGVAKAMQGDSEGAKKAFHTALKVDPADHDAGNNLGLMYLLEKKYADAKEAFLIVLGRQPGNVNVLMRLAVIEAELSGTDKALKWVQQAVELNPEDPVARAILGTIYERQGKYEETIRVTEPVATQPDAPRAALSALVSAQLKLNRFQAAIPTLERMAERDPQSGTVQQQLGQAYQATGRTDEALSTSKRALQLDPNHQPTQFLRAALLTATNKTGEARRLVNLMKSTTPDSSDLLELDGQLALRERKPAAAIQAYRRAFELREQNFQLIKLAELLVGTGRADEGKALMHDWLGKYPEDRLVLLSLSNMYINSGEYPDAESTLKRLAALQPDDAYTQNNLGWALFKQQRHQDALSHATKANELKPDDPQILDTLGAIHLALGENDKALRLLRSASGFSVGDRGIQTNLAHALVAVGQIDEAKSVLADVLRDSSPFSSRAEAERLFEIIR
ncbi:MAG: XrtA/PEP-CTERM system TPR-repeat protein PrsT [Pseudomonadota bacterium]